MGFGKDRFLQGFDHFRDVTKMIKHSPGESNAISKELIKW
jgi:hypothetical protein